MYPLWLFISIFLSSVFHWIFWIGWSFFFFHWLHFFHYLRKTMWNSFKNNYRNFHLICLNFLKGKVKKMKSIIFYSFSTSLYCPCSDTENNIPKEEKAHIGWGSSTWVEAFLLLHGPALRPCRDFSKYPSLRRGQGEKGQEWAETLSLVHFVDFYLRTQANWNETLLINADLSTYSTPVLKIKRVLSEFALALAFISE